MPFFGERNRGHPKTPVPDDLQQQPDHIQDLAIAFHQFVDVDLDTGRRSMEVLTWYLHGQHLRDCRHPRTVHLQDDFLQCTHALMESWRDMLQPHFYVLLPEPPIAEWETHVAQVVLVQQPQLFERAVLFSGVYHAPLQTAIQRIARFSDNQAHLDYCIELSEIPVQVRHRQIQAFYGWRPILRPPEEPVPVLDGASIVVHIRPHDEEPSAATSHVVSRGSRDRSRSPSRPVNPSPQSDHNDDTTSFLAHQPVPPGDVRPAVDNEDAVMQDSDLEWDTESRTSSSGSTYASDVQSHFFNILGIKVPMTATRIRTDTCAQMHSNIRYKLGLHRHDV